jgi:hypothetical protein
MRGRRRRRGMWAEGKGWNEKNLIKGKNQK